MSKQSKQAEPTSALAIATESLVPDVTIAAGDQDAIRELAYFCWQARGCPHDSPDEDWFQAERELNGRAMAAGQH